MKKAIKIIAIALLIALLLVLVPSPISTYDAFAEIIELPIDTSDGGLWSVSFSLEDLDDV